MLTGVVVALAAWDLHRFGQRLASAQYVVDADRMARSHVQRLAIVCGLGLLLASIGLYTRIRLRLGAALLLGILTILGIQRAVGLIRSERQ
jgi:hypothetical protein